MLRLFTDGSIAESEPFGEVRRKAFEVLDPASLNSLADYMVTRARFDETAFQWEHIDRMATRFKQHLRPILQSVEFAAPSTDDPLIGAVHFLKAAFPKGKPLGHYAETVIPTRCGQKFETSIHTLNARHSGRYFFSERAAVVQRHGRDASRMAFQREQCFPDLPNPFSTPIRMPRIFMVQTQKHAPLTLLLLDWSQAGRLSVSLRYVLIALCLCGRHRRRADRQTS